MDLAIVQDNVEQPNKPQNRLNQNKLLLLNDQSHLNSDDMLASSDSIFYIDPSEHFRPEFKSPEQYRIYTVKQVFSASI